MELNIRVNLQDRYLKLQEVHALAAGDIYNPITFDFGESVTADLASLTLTLERMDVSPAQTVASVVGFQSVDNHSRCVRGLLSLVTAALAEWFSQASDPIQSVRATLSDSSGGGRVYAVCTLPIILRAFNESGNVNPYYTSAQVDDLLGRKQDNLTAQNPLALSGTILSIATAATNVLGVVKTTSVVSDLTNYTACPIVNGVPYYERFDEGLGLAGYNQTGLVKTTSQVADSTGYTPAPIIAGVPYFRDTQYSAAGVSLGLIRSGEYTDLTGFTRCPVMDGYVYFRDTVGDAAGINHFGLVKTTSTTYDVTNFLPCPIVNGVPYYQDTGSTYGLGGYGVRGLVTTTSTVSDVTNYAPCPVVNGIPYYRDTGSTYGLGGYDTPGLVKSLLNVDVSGMEVSPVVNGVPYYHDTTYSAATTVLGLVRTTSGVSDVSGYDPCPIVNGVPYYRDTNTTYSAATTSLGLVRTGSGVTDVSSYTPCPIVNGVPYYKDTIPASVATAAYDVLGVVKSGTDSTDITGMSPCVIANGIPYYKDTYDAYGLAGVSAGLVRGDSQVITGFLKCPVVNGYVYYQNTDTTYGLAGLNTIGLVKTTSSVTNSAGYTPCPIINGVPYYRDTNTTYDTACYGTYGLVRSGSSRSSTDSDDIACPIISGVPYYRDTTYEAGGYNSLGLVKTTSQVSDLSGYDPCPLVGGVPYYKTAASLASLSYLVRTESSVTLQDRAMNRLTMADSSDVTLVFPSAVNENGLRARDFTLLVTLPAGSTSVGKLNMPSGLYFYWADGDHPLADNLERDEDSTVYYQFYFTEFDTDTFRVSRIRLSNS